MLTLFEVFLPFYQINRHIVFIYSLLAFYMCISLTVSVVSMALLLIHSIISCLFNGLTASLF